MNEGSSVLPVNISIHRVSPRIISLEWDILKSCSPVTNDNIVVRFKVQYTSDGRLESIDQKEKLNATKVKVSLTGLNPYTNYSIQVAVVDKVVGHFTDPIALMTLEDGGLVVNKLLFLNSWYEITL